jgi:hypothetical protein
MNSAFSWLGRSLLTCSLIAFSFGTLVVAQDPVEKLKQEDKFRQLEEILPTPNTYRNASGAPGRDYWQQTVDYVIDVELNDADRSITGKADVTYLNASPDPLKYVWMQLDPNMYAHNSDARLTETTDSERAPPGQTAGAMTLQGLQGRLNRDRFDGAVRITEVLDGKTGTPLKFTIVKTMMRIDLPAPLPTGEKYQFKVAWTYSINDAKVARGRTGSEFFEADGNYIYELAQWYPRACAYTDVTGWQHKQYLGTAEFTLEFGDYLVRITAPADHIVSASGTLENAKDVLTADQQKRFEASRTADKPMFVVTPEEAKANEASRATEKKTWVFKADNVRDFAFASSRKFIWDALGVKLGDRTVMAMSFYPNEGEPLWSNYSTHAVAHTLEVYSKFTFDYPYPVAISVNGPVGGMEYPMICFNGPRPEKDGTYSDRTKYGLISVVIHEVGHNWFPMIVNTDERQWTWMDEGLNTFMQFLAEQEWEEKYPSRRGDPRNIAAYMKSANQVPIMTAGDSVIRVGENAYAKPATALNILRETILGRELFDFAFKEYANRWKFKRPMPADFFRTMEDASGIDLDWFWRGWFYTTDHVDLAIDSVRQANFNSNTPYLEKPKQLAQRNSTTPSLSEERNGTLPKRTEKFPELKDFYNQYDSLEVTQEDRDAYDRMVASLNDEQKELLADTPYIYMVNFKNVGGLVMPLIIEIQYEDGETEVQRIPAEVWRRNNQSITKLLLVEKPVKYLRIDPRFETADVDDTNNWYPRRIESPNLNEPAAEDPAARRGGGAGGGNPMQRAREIERKREAELKKQQEEAEKAKAEEGNGQPPAGTQPNGGGGGGN